MRIKEISEAERPREKLLGRGVSSLSNGELLSVLLRTGTRGRNVVDMAQELLSLAGGNLSGLFSMDLRQICTVSGIKRDKAATLLAASELGRRFLAEGPSLEKTPVVSARMVYDEMLPRLKAVPHEETWAVLLNAAHYRLGRERIGVGGLDSTPIDVRSVVRLALDRKATALVLVHNHPGCNPRPSRHDIAMTERVKKALQAFDIELLDHVIVSDDCFYSFTDERTYGR